MSRLSIKNFGPIKSVSLDLKRINVLIGPQSSGKSTILKIASFCNWLEKRIQLSQNPDDWIDSKVFKDQLVTFHKLDGYASNGSEILFKTETLQIAVKFLENNNIDVKFKWGNKRWNYKRTKNAYIPAERNIVAAIPNWLDINFDRFNNVRNYMAEWDVARRKFDKMHKLDILDTGASYFYDESNNSDFISLNKQTLNFSNASSGLQSVIPQYTLLSYLFDYSLLFEQTSLRRVLTEAKLRELIEQNPKLQEKGVGNYYLNNCGVKVFLEEPEQNLFPQTQYALVKWLARKLNGNLYNTLFLSTHSPYILSSINNLIQASESATLNTKVLAKIKKIVGQSDFINFDEISVYGINNGRVKSLLDKENRLIAQSFLDSVSIDISKEFSNLINV